MHAYLFGSVYRAGTLPEIMLKEPVIPREQLDHKVKLGVRVLDHKVRLGAGHSTITLRVT